MSEQSNVPFRAVGGDGHGTPHSIATNHPSHPHLDEDDDILTPPRYRRIDHYGVDSTEAIAANVRSILTHIGEDPEREGLLKTPERVAKAHQFLTHGYSLDPKEILTKALFMEDYDEMILVKDIELYSLCEHHMVPFFGKAHVAYIPRGKVIGLSKIPRILEMYSRRLQIQERITHQLAEALNNLLDPAGVGVVLEGRHLCMQMRGVEKQNSFATTSAMLGEFHDEAETRAEFLSIIGLRNL